MFIWALKHPTSCVDCSPHCISHYNLADSFVKGITVKQITFSQQNHIQIKGSVPDWGGALSNKSIRDLNISHSCNNPHRELQITNSPSHKGRRQHLHHGHHSDCSLGHTASANCQGHPAAPCAVTISYPPNTPGGSSSPFYRYRN